MAEITDPATELWELFRRIQGCNISGTCRDAMASLFRCKADDSIFYSLLAVLSARCDRLIEIIDATPELDEHRSEVSSAVRNMRQIFSSGILAVNWQPLRDQYIRPESLTAVRFANLALRNRYPLKRLTDDERRELLASIDEIIAEAAKFHSISATAVRNTLEGVKLVIERFEYFGHDALIERLFLAYADLKSVEKNEGDEGSWKRHSPSLVEKALRVLAVAASVLIFADDAMNAVENDYHRVQLLVKYLSAALPSPITEMKQLPPPSAPNEPQDDQGGQPIET